MIVRLPDIDADKFHLECFHSDGSYCIDTRRCKTIEISDNVVKVELTPFKGETPLHKLQWHWNDGRRLTFLHEAVAAVG